MINPLPHEYGHLMDFNVARGGGHAIYREGMFLEIERIGESFGVRHQDIPAFITAIAEVVSRHVHVDPVEDWHGKATGGELHGRS